jgi:receptor protein-tyrosine kinase
MDTIEKALSKQKSIEQARLDSDAALPTDDFDLPKDLPSNTDPAKQKAHKIASQSGLTENLLNIDFDMLKQLGAILPDDSRSKIKEEYKHIKRPLLQKATAQSVRTHQRNLIMITSAHSGEGKTFCSLNLALSIAVERDRRVLLVDADVVKPGLGRLLGMEDKAGLVEYLNGDVKSLSDILLTTNINNLTVLPAGKTHHLSHELLASNTMSDLAEEMATRYSDRIIIFDSPPMLATSEARVLSQLVGQIVLVVEQDKTTESAVKDALTGLEPGKISGLILNKARSNSDGYYGYYYSDKPT